MHSRRTVSSSGMHLDCTGVFIQLGPAMYNISRFSSTCTSKTKGEVIQLEHDYAAKRDKLRYLTTQMKRDITLQECNIDTLQATYACFPDNLDSVNPAFCIFQRSLSKQLHHLSDP